MKTYEDLVFNVHPNAGYGFDTQALEFFPNGYGVSVVTGRAAYGGLEIAIGIGTRERWDLCYDTPITDDVIGHCTPNMITDIMKRVQELPNAEELP